MDILIREHARDERVRERNPRMNASAAPSRLGPAMLRTLASLALLSLCLLPSCSPSHPDLRPIAECPVCKCDGDLGCLIVHIDEKTPRSDDHGTTIYFCSDDCKAKFDKAPDKYPRR
jgi:YHS domain-containing protein